MKCKLLIIILSGTLILKLSVSSDIRLLDLFDSKWASYYGALAQWLTRKFLTAKASAQSVWDLWWREWHWGGLFRFPCQSTHH